MQSRNFIAFGSLALIQFLTACTPYQTSLKCPRYVCNKSECGYYVACHDYFPCIDAISNYPGAHCIYRGDTYVR